MLTIRLANQHDSSALLDIYGPYIQNTSITFETEVPSAEIFGQRITSYLINWPWLLCEVDGQVAGYAYASRYRERVAYQWSVECSVYVHDNFLRSGIARALYTALFDILRRQGFRNVYAVINLPNERSVAFHESCGFTYFATYEQVGYKLGQWKNVGWWRLVINDFGNEPAAPLPFEKLDKAFLPALFSQALTMIRR